MANTTISNAAALDACDAIVDLLDAGAGAAVLKIYDGTQPANPDVAVGGQTLLAELTCSDPAFGNAADGNPGAVATANSITQDSSANAGGTAAWFRAEDSNGNGVIDGDVTASGGGGDLELDSVSISTGVTVSVSSWTFTHNES